MMTVYLLLIDELSYQVNLVANCFFNCNCAGVFWVHGSRKIGLKSSLTAVKIRYCWVS